MIKYLFYTILISICGLNYVYCQVEKTCHFSEYRQNLYTQYPELLKEFNNVNFAINVSFA